MHLVQQNTPFTCGLACIESIATDANKQITQTEILEKYEEILRKCVSNPKDFGAARPETITCILNDLEFTASLCRDYRMAVLSSRRYAILFVPHPLGSHFYVFDSILDEKTIKAMDPSTGKLGNLNFEDLIKSGFQVILVD